MFSKQLFDFIFGNRKIVAFFQKKNYKKRLKTKKVRAVWNFRICPQFWLIFTEGPMFGFFVIPESIFHRFQVLDFIDFWRKTLGLRKAFSKNQVFEPRSLSNLVGSRYVMCTSSFCRNFWPATLLDRSTSPNSGKILVILVKSSVRLWRKS